MNRGLCVIVAMMGLFACGGSTVKTVALYKAPFEPGLSTPVSLYMAEVAARRDLEFLENDRKEMRMLARASDAFLVTLRFDGDEVLILTNVDRNGKSLVLSVQDIGKIPMSEVEALVEEVRSGLKAEFGIELAPSDR